MRKKNWLCILLFATISFAYAQEKIVSGTITDQGDVPLPGVNILVKGTTTGTQSDFDGNFYGNYHQTSLA